MRTSERDVLVPAAFAAQSGRFAARVTGTTNTSGEILLLRTGPVPVQPGQSYTLSFYVRSSGAVGSGCFPAVRLMTDKSAVSRTVNGTGYSTFSGSSSIEAWTLYTLTFTPEVDEPFADIALWRSASSGVSAALFFDDVVLEEGALSAAEVATRRARHAYSVSFSDALGKTHQTFMRLPEDPATYRIAGVEYDSAGRRSKTVLPIVETFVGTFVDAFGFHDNLVEAANAYYYYQEAVPGVGSHAYSEAKYADEPSSRAIKSAAPGTVWNLEGGRFSEGGFYFVDGLTPPANIEHPGEDNNERGYRLDWARDEDSVYTLSWTNRRGQTVQTARQTGGGTWAFTRMDYSPSGQVRRILTPLDVAASDSGFAEVRCYNAQGLLTSSFTRDRGLETYWYNKRGMLRYSQNDRQRGQSAQLFSYFDYDRHGNLVSTGEQILYYPTPVQESWVDGGGEGSPYGKAESKGYVYGSLDAFESRTGVPLDSIPHHSIIDPKHRANALIAAWHRNPESRAPGLSRLEKLVIDFYEYDEQGRLVQQHKYLGAMGQNRLQSTDYFHDEQGRLIHRSHYRNGTPYDMLMEQSYAYDPLGRVTTITGWGGDTVAQYAYAPRGVLETVTLGDPASGTDISYAYHVRGWTSGITAQRNDNGHLTWQQLLGYEDRAMEEDGVPALTQPRYTGQITQQLYKFTSDVPDPVRAVNYTYNVQGQMTISDSRHGTGLDGMQQLQFPLSLSNTDDLDARVAYDLNGRVAGKRSGGVSSADSTAYVYQAGSYRLDRVTGKLSGSGPRDASSPGNFKYDASGNLVHDGSKNLSISYNHDGMPREFMVVGSPSVTLHQLYDAAGQRVTQLTAAGGALTFWVGNPEGEVVEEGNAGAKPYDFATLGEAMAALQAQLGSRTGPAPDSVVLFAVADEGATEILPGASELTIVTMNTQTVPVVIHGLRKHSTRHLAFAKSQVGHPLYARHSVNMGGQVLSEVRETYDTTDAVTSHHVVATVLGRGTPIGRVVYTDTGAVTQFFIKNHLGSTVRVVNADGSFATTPVFDYQPYGELQSIREDSLNPVGPKYTGKGLDTEVNLYYFGARWYDQELGMWISPDTYREFFNPYGRSGNPVRYVDADGNCEIICITIIAAIAVGTYYGGAQANGSYDPTGWDYTSDRTWKYMAAGGVVGGLSAATGGAVGAAVGGGFIGGVAAGAAGGAVGAFGNYSAASGIETGFTNWSASGAWDATWKGAVAGGVGGGVGTYAGNATWNVTGKHGASLLAGAASGGTGAALNGTSIRDGMRSGAIGGLAGSVTNDVLERNFGPNPYDAQGGISSRTDLPDGTAVAFAGEGGSKWIEWLTGERYSHAGVIEGGELREAQMRGGPDIRTALTEFDSRAYTVVGRGTPNPNAITTGGYNLFCRNCSTQAGLWSGTTPANNPGIYVRINTGGYYLQPYWNQPYGAY